jgi:hypothetical protein
MLQVIAGGVGMLGALLWLLGLGLYSRAVNPLMWISLVILILAVAISSYARFQAWWHHG